MCPVLEEPFGEGYRSHDPEKHEETKDFDLHSVSPLRRDHLLPDAPGERHGQVPALRASQRSVVHHYPESEVGQPVPERNPFSATT